MNEYAPRHHTPPSGDPVALFLELVGEPARYRARLEKLAALPPWRAARLGVSAGEDGALAPFAPRMLAQEAGPLSRALARDVAAGSWEPLPGRAVLTRLDKERIVYHFEALDLCVHGVIADALARLLAPRLSPCVHSYRPGHSSLLALRAFAAHLRRHRGARPDPRSRGMFVLRRDVRAYGDSVWLAPDRPLWAQLRALLGGAPGGAEQARALSLIEKVVRPPIRGGSGGVFHNRRGLPTGSPVHNVMLNLHLTPLDDALAEVPGGFYARFGDDFIFAHEELERAREASARIDAVVAELGLSIQEKKRRNLWLNGAGRPSPAADFRSAQETLFLGAAVSFRGGLRLAPAKADEVLEELAQRLARTARLLRAGPPLSEEQELEVLCQVVADGLAQRSAFAVPHLPELLGEVDDRGSLHDLERRMAMLLLETVRGSRSPRLLRTWPLSRLRALGLPSLVQLRARRS